MRKRKIQVPVLMNLLSSNHRYQIVLVSLLILLTLTNCSSQEEKIPEPLQKLANLTVIPADIQPKNTIQIKRDTSYGSTNDLLIDHIGTIAVDDSGRVYFTAGGPNGIHVFEPDGQHLTHIGRKGQGPGEFSSAYPAIHIFSDRLFAVDLRAYRISVFSVGSLNLIRTVSINPTNQIKALDDYYIHQIIPEKGGTFLVSFKKFLREVSDLPEGTKIDTLTRSYYPMDKEGRLIPKQVLKIQDQPVVIGSVFQNIGPVSLNFFSKPLVTVSNDGSIYAAHSKDFLIKKYSPDGECLRAFYHPYQNVSLTRETALESSNASMSRLILAMSGEGMSESMIQTMMNSRQRLIRQMDLPPNWPALNDLMVDDENRLWVSTIMNDQKISQWWVLDQNGKLMARFNWPRSKPIEVVKNGYMYTRETEEETGLQTIVKYRIEMD
ncbi:6-bladed beta-propeller [Rhodohalobacter sulfatireducens]|uniref:6-bladed beta-propeller n=1 Tax=Rhodohalobacter sulfatireducens TaxID=2911366 RepID=A0ABS9KBL6_9BACT|nr:6-bladed beta-propeller [Rhodohalobacter sulfatireducens]MCG2588231.1 6-bladed beta-propeller [Rhodohalobacter sulfatireducens]